MLELAYQLVDVFTDTPFGGNQLAVFPEAPELPTETMQMIAREFNLSETTFVRPPQDSHNDVQVRIFTPGTELPFAGHPTIGTAFVLHRLGIIGKSARFEEGVGVIPVTLIPQTGGLVRVTMQMPIPQFGTVFEDRAALCAILSLTLDDLIAVLPAQAVSSGVPFLLVPVKTLDAMQRIRVHLDLVERHLSDFDTSMIFVFTPETELPGSTVHSRMFAPEQGIVEDPATGSASGPLGAYLLRYGVVDAQMAQYMISEQGFEMKRPSLIHIHVLSTGEKITQVSIGGFSQSVGAGVIYLPE